MNLKQIQMQAFINEKTLEPFCLRSRSHPLKGAFFQKHNASIKRDDQLSFSVSGSKLRKYASLLPQIQTSHVTLIGSSFSNHLVSLIPLLIEKGIDYTLFILESKSKIQGNFYLLKELSKSRDIFFIPRSNWAEVTSLAATYSHNLTKPSLVIPEGAFMKESLRGSLTICTDIFRDSCPDHIFMDSGSGFQAIASLLGCSYIKKDVTFHILIMAGTKSEFEAKLKTLKIQFEAGLEDSIDRLCDYNLYYPSSLKSFGSTSKTLFRFIKEFYQEEGIFLDPIYSGKLFKEAKIILEREQLFGDSLIIHSGGGLTLLGFPDMFREAEG